jgi:hypothetical protein
MGLLKLFTKPKKATLVRLPSGSFTVNRSGRTLVSTLPSSFPADLISRIATTVLTAFREAQEAQVALNELVIRYPTLKIVAREMRGGAIVFLVPVNVASPTDRITHL